MKFKLTATSIWWEETQQPLWLLEIVEKAGVEYENDETGVYVYINTADGLTRLTKASGKEIIITKPDNSDLWELEIYDDWRE